MVDRGYTADEILKAERFMLSMLQFELGWPGPMSFLRRISKADDYDLDTRTLAKYFLEVTVMDERFVGSPPSYTASGAHCLARMMLCKGEWVSHCLSGPFCSSADIISHTPMCTTRTTPTRNYIRFCSLYSNVARTHRSTIMLSMKNTQIVDLRDRRSLSKLNWSKASTSLKYPRTILVSHESVQIRRHDQYFMYMKPTKVCIRLSSCSHLLIDIPRGQLPFSAGIGI